MEAMHLELQLCVNNANSTCNYLLLQTFIPQDRKQGKEEILQEIQRKLR